MYSGETDGDLEWIQNFTMDMEQQVNDGRLEADHRNFTDDEEVTLLPHKRDTDVPDNPGSDVRDGPDTSDTTRRLVTSDGAPPWGSPRRNERERPPVINDRSGILDLESAGKPQGVWESRPLCCHSSGRSYWRRK